MIFVAKLAELFLVFVVSYLLAFNLIPRFFVGLGRVLGFAMKPTPLTEKRILRFKQIKRGYACFVLVTMASVMSLGLELFVNNKPIYIQYGEKVLTLEKLEEFSQLWIPISVGIAYYTS